MVYKGLLQSEVKIQLGQIHKYVIRNSETFDDKSEMIVDDYGYLLTYVREMTITKRFIFILFKSQNKN